MNKVELLSPAGDMEKLKTAIAFGADAVYFSGMQFGLRAMAGNLTQSEIKEAVSYAHQHNVKCYITMNIYANPEDFDGMEEYIQFCIDVGIDAVIVSDPGVFSVAQRLAPKMPIHISTQASVTNAEACMFWYRLGVRRIVLARELTLEQIKHIRKSVPNDMEIECFIHGAMCVSYSGRCLLSDYFTGRSGNHGECAQPCRWEYWVHEVKRPDQHLKFEHDERGSYIFNSNDLCMIEHIPELIEAGINSFKIEGRIKGAFYVASVTQAYRQAIDRYVQDPEQYIMDKAWKGIVERTVHRAFSTGFFFARPDDEAQIFSSLTYYKPAFVVGVVLDYDKASKRAIIKQKNKVVSGDLLQVLKPGAPAKTIVAQDMRDEDNHAIEAAPHAGMNFSIYCDEELVPYTYLSKDGNKDNGC